MVERREYESYIRNTIKEALSKVSPRKWALIISARNYANFEYREENFVDGIKATIIKHNDGVDPFAIEKGKNVSRKLSIIFNEIFEKITLSPNKDFAMLDLEQHVETIMMELIDLNFNNIITLQDEIKEYIKTFINYYYDSKEKIDLDRGAFDRQLKAIFNQPHLNSSIILEKIKVLITEHFECTNKEALNLATIVSDLHLRGYKLPFIDRGTKQGIDDLALDEETKEYIKEYIESGRYVKYINNKTAIYSGDNLEKLKQEFNEIIKLHPDYSQEKIEVAMAKALEKESNSTLSRDINNTDREVIKKDINLVVRLFLEQKNNNIGDLDIIKQLSVSRINVDIVSYIQSKNKLLTKKSQENPTRYTTPDKNKIKTAMKDLNLQFESIEAALIPSGLIEDYSYTFDDKKYRTEKYRRYITKRQEIISKSRLISEDRLITAAQEQAVREESIDKIIDEIVHKSANQPLRIIKYPELELFQINGIFVPKEVIDHILKAFSYNCDKAMENSYIFLSEYKNIYLDSDDNKYLLPNQDIHIFGLPKGNEGLIEIISKIREYSERSETQTRITELESDLKKELESFPIDSLPLDIQHYLKSKTTTGEAKTLEQQAIDNDRLQSIISSIIIPKTEEEKYELMAYLLNYHFMLGYDTYEGMIMQSIQINLPIVLGMYKTYFGEEYLKEKNPMMYKKALKEVQGLVDDKKELNRIKNKYNQLYSIQKILGLKHQLLAYKIITDPNTTDSAVIAEKFGSTTQKLDLKVNNGIYKIYQNETDTQELFEILQSGNEYTVKQNNTIICRIIDENQLKILDSSPKYTISSTEYGTIQIIDKQDESKIYSFDINEGITSPKIEQRKANIFGAAHIFINLIHQIYTDNLGSDKLDYEEEYNLMKIYDKLIYLRNFNYVLNIDNVYLTDFINYLAGYNALNKNSNSAPPETGIICEISALSEKLFVLFEKNICGITRFTSTQSVSETNKINSEISIVPNLITFDKTYKSLLGFGISTTERIEDTFFSAHSSIRKQNLSARQLFEQISKGAFVFRSATACDADLLYDKRELLKKSKEISDDELIDRTLKGFSNIILWLDEISLNEFQEFTRSDATQRRILGFKKGKLTDSKEELYRLKSIIYLKIQESLRNVLEYLNKKNKLKDKKYKDLIDNICNYTGIVLTEKSDGNIRINKIISQEYIINLILKKNSDEFFEYIQDHNRCSYHDFEKVLVMIATELPEYIVRIIPRNRFVNSPRINKLDLVLKKVLDYYDNDRSNYASAMLGIYDKRIPTLKCLDDKSQRITKYLDLSERTKDEVSKDTLSTLKKVIDNNILILNEKLKLLLIKKAELVQMPNGLIGKAINDVKKLASKNALEKEINHLERKIHKEKERQTKLRIIEVFLNKNAESISEEYLKSIIKLSLELTQDSLFPKSDFINKIQEIKESNHNNQNIVLLCNQLEASIIASKSFNVELKRLSKHIFELKSIMEGYKKYKERSDMVGGVTIAEDRLKESVTETHEKLKQYLIQQFYPELYKHMKAHFGDLPTEIQQEYLDIINQKVKKVYRELEVEELPSYIEMLQEMILSRREEQYDGLIEKVKTDITRIMEQKKEDNIIQQELLSIFTIVTRQHNSLKENTLIEIIREYNGHSIMQLTNEEKKQIAVNINEQYMEESIISEFVKTIIVGLKNKILKESVLPLKIEYIEKIYKINIKLKTYYNYLMSLPEAIRLRGDYNYFKDNNSLKIYYDMIQIYFKETTMALREKYGDDVYDPTDGTYGKNSSIKTS